MLSSFEMADDDSLDAFLGDVDLDGLTAGEFLNEPAAVKAPAVLSQALAPPADGSGPTAEHLATLKNVFGHSNFRHVQWDIIKTTLYGRYAVRRSFSKTRGASIL